jgi:Domain of unknown function (DUF397)
MSIDPTQWITASASGSNGNCVQMRAQANVVELRDTKAHGEGPSLRIAPAAFGAWVDGAKRGEFDHLL